VDLRHGKRLPAIAETELQPTAAFDEGGRLVAMLTKSGKDAKSLVVFPETDETAGA